MEHQTSQTDGLFELSEELLNEVFGGINPQPLPPCHKED